MFTSMIILLRGIWRLLLRLFKLKEKYHRTLLVRCLKFVLFCTNCINCRIFFYYFLILVPCVLLLIWLHSVKPVKICTQPTSIYDAATSECFSFVLAINISQKTDHHSNRKPPGASIAATPHCHPTRMRTHAHKQPNQ